MRKLLKNKIFLSAIISFVICTVCLLINLICVFAFNTLPLSISMHGGEVTEYAGFGIMLEKIFPLSATTSSIIDNIYIDIFSYIMPFLLFFIIIYIIITIVSKNKASKSFKSKL